jgi:hypothetical protein
MSVVDGLADLVGEEYFVAGSFRSILEEAARIPLVHADVQLGAKVVSVTSSASADQVSGRQGVTVMTEGGKTQSFDEVVVAIPLGCLKMGTQVKQIFDPPLTPGLTAAIDAISIGHLEKVSCMTRAARWLASPLGLTGIGIHHIPESILEKHRKRRSQTFGALYLAHPTVLRHQSLQLADRSVRLGCPGVRELAPDASHIHIR